MRPSKLRMGPSPATPPCPYLPVPRQVLTARSVASMGDDRGPAFYFAALEYAHSLWLQGLPARALLLLNRALGCDLRSDDPVLTEWPLPYNAVAWVLHHHVHGQFLGNPRRHWQHLATRLSGPRAELRTWRAWACWRLACIAIPDLPADSHQLVNEGIREPTEAEIAANLNRLGHPGESAIWESALQALQTWMEASDGQLNGRPI